MWAWTMIWACGGEAPPIPAVESAPAAAAAPIDLEDPATCAPCHAAIVEEWASSMHARSDTSADPLYAAMKTYRMGVEGAEIAGSCHGCHNPRDPGDPTSVIGARGVTCATCHTTIAVKSPAEAGGRGARQLVAGDAGTLYGPKGPTGAASPHPVGPASAVLTDGSSVCLACHADTANPAGVPACTTGSEAAVASVAASCASCHMARAAGPASAGGVGADHASHAFPGGHVAWTGGDAAFLADAVSMSGALTGESLSVTLTNRSGHGFPTGFPARVAVLKVTGSDAAGSPVWTNWTGDVMAEDPQSAFNKVYVDAAGQPTLSSTAATLKRDNRLATDEVRTLTWTVPATVQQVQVDLVFRLIAPPAAQKIGFAEAPEAQPRKIHSVTVSRADQ